jgi:prefoldin subunit 5
VAAPGYTPFSPQMSREEELDYLREQAEAIKSQLDQIDSRMRDLESGQKE